MTMMTTMVLCLVLRAADFLFEPMKLLPLLILQACQLCLKNRECLFLVGRKFAFVGSQSGRVCSGSRHAVVKVAADVREDLAEEWTHSVPSELVLLEFEQLIFEFSLV
jgi:hypothetical protein